MKHAPHIPLILGILVILLAVLLIFSPRPTATHGQLVATVEISGGYYASPLEDRISIIEVYNNGLILSKTQGGNIAALFASQKEIATLEQSINTLNTDRSSLTVWEPGGICPSSLDASDLLYTFYPEAGEPFTLANCSIGTYHDEGSDPTVYDPHPLVASFAKIANFEY